MPPGDGTPEDDYPLRVQQAVSGYVRGQLLFSLIMGTSAGVALWIFGVLGIFPDGQTLRAVLRRLLRADGARPVRRPGPRRAAADPRRAVRRPADRGLGRRCCSSRSSSSRATSSRRRSSATRCASTRCSSSSRCCSAPSCTASSARSSRCRSPRSLRETVVYLRRHLVLEPWATPTPASPRTERRRPSQPPASAKWPTATVADAWRRDDARRVSRR